MYIDFKPEKMHVQVICGTLEEYSPSEKTKEIHEKVSKLKAKMEKFKEDVVNPELDEINKLVEEHNKKFIKE